MRRRSTRITLFVMLVGAGIALTACQLHAAGIVSITLGSLLLVGGAVIGLLHGCAHRGPLRPCLSVVAPRPKDAGETRQDAGAAKPDARRGPAIAPCLKVAPCLEAPQPKPKLRPCLSVKPKPKPKPRLPVCLSVAPPEQRSEAPPAMDRDALLARHGEALPRDVRARLERLDPPEGKNS